MKKSFFLLPLVVSMTLTACSSSSDTEASVADAAGSSASTTAIPTWQSGDTVQSADMPASMISAPTHTMGQAQTTYNNAQTTYSNAQQTVQQAPQQVTAQASANYGSQTESVGQCQVVRDSGGAPIYAQMVKGCYTDSNYTVGKSDTMYLISYLTGQTPAQIAALNNISTTTKLQVGQVLRVR